MKVRIEKFKTFEFDGGKGIALEGRSEEKKYRTCVAFGPVGASMAREMFKIAGGADKLSNIHERRIVVELEGEWGTSKNKGKPSFKISGFTFLSGPSAELFRAKSKACEVSAQAGRLHADGKFEEAYLLLEEYVALFAMVPIPSVDGPAPLPTLGAVAAVPAEPAEEASADEGVDLEAGALERFGVSAPGADAEIVDGLPSVSTSEEIDPDLVSADPEASSPTEVELESRIERLETAVEAAVAEMAEVEEADAAEEIAASTDATVETEVVVEASAVEAVVVSEPVDDMVASEPAEETEDVEAIAEPAAEVEAQPESPVVVEVAAAPEPEPEPAPVVETKASTPSAAPAKTAAPASSPVAAAKPAGFRPGGFRPGGLAGFRPAAPRKEVELEVEPEAEVSGPRM